MLTSSFLSVARAYCAAEGVDLKRLSSRMFDDAKVLPRLDAGQMSITLIRADRALCWLSANWPADAAWPDGVERPDPDGSAAGVHLADAMTGEGA